MALGYLMSLWQMQKVGPVFGTLMFIFKGQFFFSMLFLPGWTCGLKPSALFLKKSSCNGLIQISQKAVVSPQLCRLWLFGLFGGCGLQDPSGGSCWALCCCWCGFSAWCHMAWALLVSWVPHTALSAVFNFFLYFSLYFNIFTGIPQK